MPVYQYENPTTGEVIEELRTIAARDLAPKGFARITVPVRLAIGGTSSTPICETDAEAAVPRAFRQLEETKSWRAIEKGTGFSRDHIRRVWDF